MFRLALLALLFSTAPVFGGQFTVRCDRGDFYFLTFDTNTNRMISETVGGGTFRGQIKESSDTEVRFVLLIPGLAQPDLFLMRQEGRVDVQKGSNRTVTLYNCVNAPLRDVLKLWDQWG